MSPKAYSAATYSEVQLVQNSCKISNQQEFQKQAELQVLEEREKRKQQQEMGNNVTIEETIFIRPNENIIEIEPDQVSCIFVVFMMTQTYTTAPHVFIFKCLEKKKGIPEIFCDFLSNFKKHSLCF